MKIRVLFLLIALLASSCLRDDELSVTFTSLEENSMIMVGDEISFNFSHALKDMSTMDRYNFEEYFELSPTLSTGQTWKNANTFALKVYRELVPGQEYTFKFNKNILTLFDSLKSLKNETFKFKASDFEALVGTNQWRTNRVSPGDVLVQEIDFNYDVDIENLSKKIKFIVDGKEVSFSCVDSYYERKVQFELNFDNAPDFAGKDMTIIIDKWISVYNTKWESKQKIELKTKLPMLDDLEISKVGIINDFDTKGLKLFFNQELVSESVSMSKIKFDPEVKFDMTIEKFGLFIKGNFEYGKTYNIAIEKSLKSIYNKSLKEDYSHYFTFEEPEPAVSFSSKGSMYLLGNGSKNIGLNIAGLDKVTIEIHKIYENNLVHFFENGVYYDYYYKNGDYYDIQRYRTGSYGDKIFEKTYEVSKMPTQGNTKIFNFNPTFDISKTGIYVINIFDPENRYSLYDNQLIALSNLGIITKMSENDLYVYVNSLSSASPMSNATVGIISSKNQKHYSAKTNSQGVAVIKNYKQSGGIAVLPSLVYAAAGNDINYLQLSYDNRHQIHDFNVFDNLPNKYRTFAYGDRRLYRPGDTLVIAGIVRDNKLNTLANVPITAEIITPTGNQYKKLKINLNSEGGFSEKIYMPANVPTGTYSINYKLNEEEWLGSYSVKIEEFMPEQLKINLRTDKESYKVNDSIRVDADVETLYGLEAPGMKYELNYQLRRKRISFKDYKNYHFNLENELSDGNEEIFRNLRTDIFTDSTDTNGKIGNTYQISNTLVNNGILNCNVFLTVFDENGRPVYKNKNLDVFTQEIYYGLGETDYYYSTNKPIEVPLAAVNQKGNPVPQTQAKITLIKNIWHNIMVKDSDGNLKYSSQKEEKVIEEKTVTIYDKQTKYTFTPEDYGSYEVRISSPLGANYVAKSFYCYDWNGWGNSSENVEVDKEGKITIETDKEEYLLQEKCKVLFKAPFDGKMLVSLERNDVYESKILEVKNKTASMIIDLHEDYLPNVYISAILYRPVDNQAIPITVATGVKSIDVRKKEYKINLSIEAPEKVRSKTHQTIKIKTDRKNEEVMLTVAAVDEGILQINNYKTPDPYKFFYSPMNLNVSTYSLYKKLYPELKIATSHSGAGGFEMKDRLNLTENPLANKRVNLLASWSGIIKTNSSGSAEVPLDIPQFAGEVRIMAQAYKGKSFGAADNAMKVADPVVINASVPRFLYPKDQFDMAVTVRNTENKQSNCEVEVVLSKNLKLTGESKIKTKLDKLGQIRVNFPVEALSALGEELITIKTKAHGETFEHKTYINIQAASGLIKKTKFASITNGDLVELDLLDDFIPQTHSAKVIISKSPLLEHVDKMYKLIEYPHGCAEQTISKAFPQIYFADLLPLSDLPDNKNSLKVASKNVNAAIIKLSTLQNWDGGIKYWSSSYESDKWVSVYAAHFMVEAKKQGYNVDESIISKLLDYIESSAISYATVTYVTEQNGKTEYKSFFPRRTVYGLYVLALSGRYNSSALNKIKEMQSQLTLDSKYMLAGAFLASGDKKSAKEILSNSDKFQDNGNETGGSFSSYVRNMAISLMVLIETDPSNDRIPGLAKDLAKEINQRDYLSTNDLAFAVMSLGKLSQKTISSDANGIITYGSKSVSLGANNYVSIYLKGKNAQVKSTGKGDLYYYYEAQGLTKSSKVKETDSKISIRRTYYDRNGNKLKPDFEVGQFVVVELELKMLNQNSYIENIAITDMLPAGLEIVNERLYQETPTLSWMSNSAADYTDLRDDRVNLFTSLTPNKTSKKFYYKCRAVTKGTYSQGVLSADAMYDGSFRSYVAGEKVTVR